MSYLVVGRVAAPAGVPLVFATDGSSDARLRNSYRTGFGWLSTDGRWGTGWCPQPAVLIGRDIPVVAELRAVYHAVKEELPHRRVTIMLDSKVAIGYLRSWTKGELRMPAGYLGSQKHTPMLTRLARLVAAHPGNLHATWVRGHSGHLLNECADSLAKLGRRSLVEHLKVGEVRRRAEWLVSGFLADPRIRAAA
ncbi:RNase H family protein [Micromonospora sp. RV43]|uniref:RNase H family protein n=1 Tax=Micromonospora sp. RV43 TaxID=1661387 RepID=UPI00064C32ED|nr:RNase H family protein [Micromonospora sp. RV43]